MGHCQKTGKKNGILELADIFIGVLVQVNLNSLYILQDLDIFYKLHTQKYVYILLFSIDKVSWLPPGHPKAKITEAASHVREMIQNQIHMEPDNDDFDRLVGRFHIKF